MIQPILAEMAWERLPPDASLLAHLYMQVQILDSVEGNQELWRRMWKKLAGVTGDEFRTR